MSFKAYMENIQAKTGKSPEDFINLAEANGFIENRIIKKGIKAGDIVKWLKEEYGLGHGHAMSIYAYFSGKRE